MFPCQLPNKARTHCDVPIIEWLIDLATNQIHTIALQSPSRDCGLSGRRRLSYPHLPLIAERLLSNRRRYHQTAGAPLAATTSDYRLPKPIRLIWSSQLVSDLCDLTSLDRLSSYSCDIPFEMYTSRTNLGLVICRKVADMTSYFAFPPVLDSHPPSSGSC